MSHGKVYAMLMVLCLAGLGLPGLAAATHGTGTVYISPVLAHWIRFQAPNQMNNAFLWGARVGVDFMPTLGLEAFGMRGLTEVDHITDRLDAGTTTIDARYDVFGLGLRLNLPYFGSVVPFLSASGGQAWAHFDAPITSINYSKVSVDKTENRALWVFGTGAEVFLTRNVALRFDAQDHFINTDFISGDRRGNIRTHNWEFGVGVTLLFGGRKKAQEPPPPTPTAEVRRPPVPVREQQPAPPPVVKWADSDGDGVPDAMDKCPETRVGVPVDMYGCPKESPEQYEIMCLFDFDESVIKPEFSNALDALATLVLKTGARLSITGYADQVGKVQYNIELADRRAHAVRDYLGAKGIPAERFELKAFGEYPVDTNGNPIAYYQRCVQFKLIK